MKFNQNNDNADLIAAAERVIATWESGDLVGAVRKLADAVNRAKAASADEEKRDRRGRDCTVPSSRSLRHGAKRDDNARTLES
jgi:hypothetical protein